jgi:hypothetical protein
MHLISVCNKRCPGLDLWEKTAHVNFLHPVILGLEDKRELGHDSEKFGLKFILLDQYLQTLDPSELCLVTDGFDVIFYQCTNLHERLLTAIHPSEVLFAADVYENPDQGGPYKTKAFKAPYLNSGVYAGRAGVIRAILRNALEKKEKDILFLDDQRYFTQYMFQNPGVIRIDHACEHFACTAGLEYKKDFLVHESKLQVFSNFPCVLHFQGFYKDTRIIDDLQFDSEIKTLGRKLLRRPSPWGKAIGDFFVQVGSYFPLPKKFHVHTGISVLLLLLALLCNCIGIL